MSSAQHYIDARAFDEYEENDGQEVVVSALVDMTTSDAFDAWLTHVWVARSPAIAPGDGRGLVGHARQLSLGVVEQIVSVGLPLDGNAPLIPSVCYKMRKFGPLPMQDHIGFVRFVPDTSVGAASPKTLVLWTVKVTPTTAGNVFLCGGSLLRLVTRSVLTSALGYMPHATAKRDKKHSSPKSRM